MELEHKFFKFRFKEIDVDEGIFTGHAAAFSDKPDSYGDIIDPGAFVKTLKERGGRVKSLWNHSVMEPIGKPIELAEDKKGLAFKIQLSLGVQRAREVFEMIKDGVITEMSIGYDTMKENFKDGIRHLQEIRLWDISPVTFAANPLAQIESVKDRDIELKPFPNEHACRLNPPGKYDKFRRGKRKHEDKEYSVIYGKLKGEAKWEDQAYRYDIAVWEKADAKSHCLDHDGKFEAAEGKEENILSAANIADIRSAMSKLQALLESATAESEPEKSTQLGEVAKEAAQLEEMVNSLKAVNDGFDLKKAERCIEAILGKIQQEVK